MKIRTVSTIAAIVLLALVSVYIFPRNAEGAGPRATAAAKSRAVKAPAAAQPVTAAAEPAAAGKDDKESSASGTPELSPRFRSLDADHDGKVTQEEFLKRDTEQFQRMDADHDDALSPDEVDFPPGITAEMKEKMRQRRLEGRARMEKMHAEMEARRAEAVKNARAPESGAASAVADKVAPAVTDKTAAPAAADKTAP